MEHVDDLQPLVDEFLAFCREEECWGGDYWDQDYEASDEWIEQHVPASQEDAFRDLVGF